MDNQNSNTGGVDVKKRIVPGAIPAMVWGIISIATLMYFGWVASIVAFSVRRKALKLYEENPSNYNEKSLNFIRTAKVCATIGLWVSIFSTLLFILYIIFIITIFSHSYSPYYY